MFTAKQTNILMYGLGHCNKSVGPNDEIDKENPQVQYYDLRCDMKEQ